MKRAVWMLMLLLSVAGVAHADDVAKRAKVEKLLGSMHMDRMMDQMMQMAKQQATAMMAQTDKGAPATPTQQRIDDRFKEDLLNLVMGSVSWKAMEPEFVELYVKNFTDAEIDAMAKFYDSAEGQSMLEKMPQITAQSMQMTQERMKDLLPKIQALGEKYARERAAAGKSSTPKS